MEEIELLRKEIDRIDTELTALLCERFDAAREIGALKRAAGIERYDPARERAIMEATEAACNRYRAQLRRVYQEIFAVSKTLD
ncbi:MAG: chorismate mutase [Defluviitaleaceae bacterium]|nr:chorismate mutase [Defluviitaleaceae bacterium]